MRDLETFAEGHRQGSEDTMREMSAEASVRPPSTLLRALEIRAVGERAAMALSSCVLDDLLPTGDGHPVLVLPGFTAGDRSTAPLRRLLDRLDYRSYGWELGANIGPTAEIMAGLPRLIDRIVQRESTRLSIVGWSLGGIYGREMARQHPDIVRQVTTLGSPIQMMDGEPTSATPIWESLRHRFDHEKFDRSVRESERPALGVPSTAIYTRTDGVVTWRMCLARERRTSENVEVYGSHCGLGFNPSVAYVVADRLSQPDGEWKQFRAPMALRPLYPKPASHASVTQSQVF